MQAHTTVSTPAARLPRLLSLPFAMTPGHVHSRGVVAALNRVLAAALREGELDFLEDRSVRIRVEDMGLDFAITLDNARLAPAQNSPDLTIAGTLHAFLLLAARREDSDTLFFQRRLRMEGDTELGLEVKNFLDGLDVESHWLPRQVEALAQRALPFYERVFGSAVRTRLDRVSRARRD